MREDFIQYWIRQHLANTGWQLVAGQYPNGTDDLPPLNVVDPVLARDDSPDHRRHSANKLVPDLVAVKDGDVVVAEMKPRFDAEDVAKLRGLATTRRGDFDSALAELSLRRRLQLDVPRLRFVPALGFADMTPYPAIPGLRYFLVQPDGAVRTLQMEGCLA